MATVQTNQKWRSRNAMTAYDHDPGTTDATIVSPDGGTTKRYVDMQGYGLFVVNVFPTVNTGDLTAVAIVAATDSSGTDQTTIKTVASGLAADALGDFVCGEVTAEEVAAAGAVAGKDFRYVSAVLTCDNAGNEAIVQFILSEPGHSYGDLTPTSSIA